MLNLTECQILQKALEELPLDTLTYWRDEFDAPIDDYWVSKLIEKLETMEGKQC